MVAYRTTRHRISGICIPRFRARDDGETADRAAAEERDAGSGPAPHNVEPLPQMAKPDLAGKGVLRSG